MNPKVDAWLDAHREDIIRSLQESIAIPSVKSEAAPNAPFGTEVRASLDHALGLAKNLGFATTDMEGYIGYAEFGKGEELIGVLCHLDVVPAGVGWKYPAFGGEIHDDKLYGRGTLDDKGPAIAALYAMAAVKECGLEPRRRVRLILGCDEESGMQCLDHYCAHGEIPMMSFSPDAEYPLVNSEKHNFTAYFAMPYASSIQVEAGERTNVVPGEASATVPLSLTRILPIMEAYMEKSEYGCAAEAIDEESAKITVSGLNAHASLPEQGRNALLALLDLLAKLPLPEADAKAVSDLSAVLGMYYNGQPFGLDKTDASGRLTHNVGVMRWNEKGIESMSIDIRAPISMTREDLENGLCGKLCPIGMQMLRSGFSKGYCQPRESELVSKLLDVYSARTGEKAEPLAIGGGTYARHLKEGVAFGMLFPGEPELAHQANENIDVANYLKAARIYAYAIVALCA